MCRDLVADLNYATTVHAFPHNVPDNEDILGLIPRDHATPLPVKYVLLFDRRLFNPYIRFVFF